MKVLHALWVLAALCVAPIAWAEEPDHAIHEELRGVLHEIMAAINSGQYDKMLPYLTENVEATSITQEVMSNRADVSKYFQEWFGPTGYMRKMEIILEARTQRILKLTVWVIRVWSPSRLPQQSQRIGVHSLRTLQE